MRLELDNVELYHKSKLVLNSIYLKAESGHLTHISGANGSGKSSLLRIIFGDLQPKYKLLRLDQKPVMVPLYTLGQVKWLPENSFMPLNLPIRTAFQKYAVSWEAFKSLFEDFVPHSKSKFKNLSSGERRLVEAFLILKSPSKIVLLDEPFKSLSPVACERLKDLISEEKTAKLIISADHHTQHWEGLADRFYRLKDRGLKLLN